MSEGYLTLVHEGYLTQWDSGHPPTGLGRSQPWQFLIHPKLDRFQQQILPVTDLSQTAQQQQRLYMRFTRAKRVPVNKEPALACLCLCNYAPMATPSAASKLLGDS